MLQEQDGMDEIDDRDREVLEVLADGRANPKLIRDETALDKGDVNTVLVRLGRGGLVRQVTRGLYEITDEGREEIGATTCAVNREELKRALDGIDDAAARGDTETLRSALDHARRVIDDE
jgi:DNA-binding MarR family transcriptional regulator